MKYFSDFPIIDYKFEGDTTIYKSIDITKRFKPLESILDNVSLYYEYTIKENETPRILSHKIYGDEQYHWILLMFNQRLNPYYQWPLPYEIFNKYIEEKYGSIEYAMNKTHSYYQIIQKYEKHPDGSTTPERLLLIDYTRYATLAATDRKYIKAYDYEFNKNEELRKIKIIDALYIPQIMAEKENILK